jgi:hypothetical protein
MVDVPEVPKYPGDVKTDDEKRKEVLTAVEDKVNSAVLKKGKLPWMERMVFGNLVRDYRQAKKNIADKKYKKEYSRLMTGTHKALIELMEFYDFDIDDKPLTPEDVLALNLDDALELFEICIQNVESIYSK